MTHGRVEDPSPDSTEVSFHTASVSSSSHLLLLLRIKGVSPKVRHVIQMFRLRKLFSGVFIKINKSSLAMLKVVEPYVAWG